MNDNEPVGPDQQSNQRRPAVSQAADPQAGSRARHPAARGLREGPGSPAHDEAALHFEQAAVRWLAQQTPRLAEWPPTDSERESVLGAVADIALLVELRLRRDLKPLNGDYSTLLTLLTDIAEHPATAHLLREDERAIRPLAAVQGALRANWQPDTPLAGALAGVLDGRPVQRFVRAPAEQVALHIELGRAGFDVPCQEGQTTLLGSALLPDAAVALNLTRRKVLTLVSVVLAASDYGHASISWPRSTTAVGLADGLREWLVLAWADEDAGLVAALLGGLDCLCRAGDELEQGARRWLHGWQESDGRVEGRSHAGEEGADDLAVLRLWSETVNATAMTALDSLLQRGRSTARTSPTDTGEIPGYGPEPQALTQSIMAAADWLDAVLPGTHVQGRLWTSEAWLALGDEAEARRQLMGLAKDPDISLEVLLQSGDRAVHLAALLVALNVSSPTLTDLCDDVAALVAHPEAARALLAPSRARARAARAEDTADMVLPASQAELRSKTEALCSALLRHGPLADPASPDGVRVLLMLAGAARIAAAAGDLGWLALVLRGLHRLVLVPERLTKDVTVLLQAQQRPDGAIGPRPPGRPGPEDRQVRWTLQALSALVEEVSMTTVRRAA